MAYGTDSEEFIYAVNLIIFPIVVAGYLAVLFADGIDYWKKLHPEPEKRKARKKQKARKKRKKINTN